MRSTHPQSFADPTRWVELRSTLSTAYHELGANGFLPPSIPRQAIRNASGEERRLMLAQSYEAHNKTVARAVQQRFDKGSWPELSPIESHYASIVVRYASMFVAHVCPEMETGCYSTVCPFPDASVEDVAVYLCTLWWHKVGWLDYSRDITDRIEPLA